jgi:uncharacterized repeat protein (TIGR03803 family)
MKTVYRAVALILALTGFAWVSPCTADNATTIYQFKGGDDGTWPYAGLLEYQGEFYGTTWKGGTSGYGTIFKLTPPAKGQSAWTKTVLHNFTSKPDGAYPWAGLIHGGNGNFYGTTNQGGEWGWGTIFQLSPPATPQGEWTVSTIYSFCSRSGCLDGTYPQASLLLGADGTLYGTTSKGGGTNSGVVFRLKLGEPFSVIYDFCNLDACADGWYPVAELIADKQGALYGTTLYGGAHNSGTAFKLTPPAAGASDWTQTVLYSFCHDGYTCYDGLYPGSGLVFDTQGNLYGTTFFGGKPGDDPSLYGSGTVFKLTPPGNPGNDTTGWEESVTYNFTNGTRGDKPGAALIVDSQNNLYGTTQFGGAGPAGRFGGSGLGAVFKLGPPHSNGTHRTLAVLTSFAPASGDPVTNDSPQGPVTLYQGALYGTTAYGGVQAASCVNAEISKLGCGSIFKVPLSTGAPKPTGGGKLKEPHGSGDDDVPASPTD